MTYYRGLWVTTALSLLLALFSLVSYASAPSEAQAARAAARATVEPLNTQLALRAQVIATQQVSVVQLRGTITAWRPPPVGTPTPVCRPIPGVNYGC